MKLKFDRPLVMGILNVTPDSFSDGGRFVVPDSALRHVEQMVNEGAGIIDVGGESTRPGAEPVSEQQELDRVVPIVAAIKQRFDVPVSVDTCKPVVMRETVAAGADMLNDVYALRAEGALEAVAALDVPVCLMHMQGEPRTMQDNPVYQDVVGEIKAFFEARIEMCEAAGIKRERILLDPGFGFGKRLAHNLTLLKHLTDFKTLGLPLLIGVSRKRMIGAVLGKDVDQRLFGSIAAASLAVWQGAKVIRAHDVAATVDAVKLVHAVMQEHG